MTSPDESFLDELRLFLESVCCDLCRFEHGCVGDAINLAARLNGLAGTGEIVVSNSLYQRLPESTRAEFAEMEPVEAKNWGRVRAWKRGVR